MLMDGLTNRKSSLHFNDSEIHGPELKCNGDLAMILAEEGLEEPPKDLDFSSEVAVQATLSSTYDGEFTFSCVWESPGNAISQCNIINGWIVGVPTIPLRSSGLLADDYEPPTKIRLRNEANSRPSPSLINAGEVIPPDVPADTNAADQKSKGFECKFNSSKGISVISKSTQVNLPNNLNCESLKLSCSAKKRLLKDCTGFHGYSSITSGIDWKLGSLCGIQKSVFDRYLPKICPVAPWEINNKTALLIVFTKLKLGLSFTNLAIFFGSDSLSLSHMFNDALDKVHRSCEKDIEWPSLSAHKELPSYFQGLYKESRVILICSEIEVEQPEDVQLHYNLFSSTSRIHSYKIVIGMTPIGRVCFKSKAYEGRKSFKRVLKDCGFLSNLNSKELVLTRSIIPEMDFIVKKGVLLVAPQSSSNDSSAYDTEEDIGQHIERCEKRLKFFKVLNKIPIALSSKIDELIHVCCCLINELPPLLRYDQPEDEEL